MTAEDAKHIAPLVSPRSLRRLAGERYYGRGEAYFADGAVRSLSGERGGVKAVVRGTRSYRVRLWVEDGDLGHDCSCPLGRDGAFCKHCVAVGLAWHAAGQGSDGGAIEDLGTAFGEEALRAYLLGLEKERLVTLILERADADERLYRRLAVQAAQSTPESANSSVWKQALDDALAVDDFVHYREAYDYACGIDDVIESLEDLLRAGQAERVMHLAEYGVTAVEQSLDHIDDSDGWMGGHLDRLQELHLEACRMAKPDPEELAERLFEAEMESDYDAFHQAARVYADILGEAGLAAYHRLAEAEWAKVPALGPGDKDPNRYGSRFRITSIMEAIAEASGDLAAVVAIKSHDLSSPYDFLEIARLYRDAGEAERALDWAERGWQAFSGRDQDERLRTFIAAGYQQQGRHDDAMALGWEAFAEDPRLETYLELKRYAGQAGQWSGSRDKALALIRERIARAQQAPSERRPWVDGSERDHSLLVEVFLHEGDPETAWREAATGGCRQGLWLELAKGRARSHPDDAVRIYRNHVASLLRDTGDRVYEEAVGFLEKIRAILVRSGEEAAFRSLVNELRTTHRRKRNLMKMLDGRGW